MMSTAKQCCLKQIQRDETYENEYQPHILNFLYLGKLDSFGNLHPYETKVSESP